MARRRVALILAALVVALGTASTAHAQPRAADGAALAAQMAQAREQFNVGVAAGQRGDWRAASDAFERAEALYPTSRTLLNLALAQTQSGRLVAALESYRRFQRTAEPDAMVEQRDAVEAAIAALAPRIAHVRLQVAPLERADRVELDGARIVEAGLGVELPIDAGTHALAVRRDGAVVASTEFASAEGASSDVALTVPARAPAPPLPAVLRPERPRVARRGVSPWIWVGVGIVAALAIGAGVAIVLLSDPGAPPFSGNISPGMITVP